MERVYSYNPGARTEMMIEVGAKL